MKKLILKFLLMMIVLLGVCDASVYAEHQWVYTYDDIKYYVDDKSIVSDDSFVRATVIVVDGKNSQKVINYYFTVLQDGQAYWSTRRSARRNEIYPVTYHNSPSGYIYDFVHDHG